MHWSQRCGYAAHGYQLEPGLVQKTFYFCGIISVVFSAALVLIALILILTGFAPLGMKSTHMKIIFLEKGVVYSALYPSKSDKSLTKNSR